MKLRLVGLTAALLMSLVSMAPVSAQTTTPPPPPAAHKDCSLNGQTYPHGAIEKVDGKWKECMDGKWITPTRTDVP